jgi:hypothetical protein
MKRKNRTYLVAAALLAIAAIAGAFWFSGGDSAQAGNGHKVVVYKTPLCGCCGQWSHYLRREGYDVELHSLDDLSEMFEENGVPANLQSCHLAFSDGYFIVGHVPVEVIQKLTDERPEIDGISLPGMPAGSPGMPGQKDEAWTFYSLDDGQADEFITL